MSISDCGGFLLFLSSLGEEYCMKKLRCFRQLRFHATGNLLIALTIMALPVSAGLLCLSVPDVLAADFILSGGEDSSAPICVDDQINVYVNGNAVFTDYGLAGCKGTIPLQAEEGDLIAIEVIDAYGSCRSLTPIYIHRSDCDAYDLITKGRNDGCNNYPASSDPFITVSYRINLAKLSCPEISVTKMRCKANVPTMVLWDEKGRDYFARQSGFSSRDTFGQNQRPPSLSP